MAELGEKAVAHSILESSLSAIRQEQSLNPVKEDYTLVSQESVVMLLLWAVEHGKNRRELYSESGSLLNELFERWNDLARYRCDPRREIASLSARLRHRSQGRGEETKTHSFDLGMISKTIHFGFDEEIVAAYGLLRMYEDIGMPYRMEHTIFARGPIESTLLRVRPYSPHWALANIVRLGDARAADGLFDREYLAGLKRDEVDSIFQIYLPAFERTVAKVNEPDEPEAKTFELLAKTLPELFSRLCYKCSPEYRERLLGALSVIYSSKRRDAFAGIRRFAERLFGSMSAEERACAVPSLLDFPMPADLNEIEKWKFVNPVLLLGLHESVRGDVLPVTSEKIDELLDKLAEDGHNRDWTETILFWLHDRDKLNQRQSERLGEVLWEGVEASGVPIVTGFLSFECIALPHPAEIDPGTRVKKRLRTMIDDRMEGSRLDEVRDELRRSAGVVGWSQAEALELVATISGWWIRNKHQLHYQAPMLFGAPADNLKRTIWKAVFALSAVFSQLAAAHGDENVDSLCEFLADLAAHDIPTKVLEAATLSMVAGAREQVPQQVAAAMLDKDHDVVFDALMAARVFVRASAGKDARCDFTPVVNMLFQGVQWRHRPALSDRLRVVADLVKKHPRFLSKESLTCLLAGLGEIAEETSRGVRGNDQDGVISIRASAASLAFALFGHYQESGSDVPEAIGRWREICSDSDEFSEVRNS